MLFVIVMYIAAFSLFLFMGVYVFVVNPTNRINILFFALSLFMAVTAFGGVLVQVTDDLAVAQWWFKFGTACTIFFPSLVLIFGAEISSMVRKKFLFYALISAPTLALFIRLMSHHALVDLTRVNGIRVMREILFPVSFLLNVFLFVLAMIGYLVIMLIWRKRTTKIKEKRQAAILLYSYLIGIVAALIVLILVYLKIIPFLLMGFGIFFQILWYIAVFYCIARFRFLSITPELVSRELIASIDEAIILLDSDKKIVFSNEKIGTPMKHVNDEYSGLNDWIVECGELENEIDRLLEGECTSFVCRCTFRGEAEKPVLVNAKFSLVNDRYGDILGIMIVAKSIKGIKQLKSLYRITRREAQILQRMILGLPYHEIASALNITKNTLKRHIANIYIKLGVNNRVELINLLREYHLTPADEADRIVLISGRPTQ